MHVQIQPWMVLTWAVVSAALLALLLYRATLTQHETDQLFLADEESRSANHVEHDRILARVESMRPLCQGLTGATVLMSALIAGLYVIQVWPQVNFPWH